MTVGDTKRWLALLTVSLAVSLIIVDSTIVNVAIPSIVDELGIDSAQVQWVQESYTLVFAAFLLVFGTLADRVGRKRMLSIGVVVFVLASIAAALAPTGELLIAARVVQGVGGAIMLPVTLSILNATFEGRERAIAFAVWGSTIGGMAAVGPLLGGWLTEFFSWRWAFGINLPLGLLILVGALLFVAESRAETKPGLDPVGAVISVVLFGALVLALIEGRTWGWWLSDEPPAWWTAELSPIPLVALVAVLALVAFVLWGRARTRAGKAAMLPMDLFRIRSFRNGNLVAMIVSLGEFGVILSLPLWAQNVLGYSATQTGLVLLALAGGSFLASGAVGGLISRVSGIAIVRAGILAEIAGLVVLAIVIAVDTPWWAIAIGLFLYGFGVGLATAQLTSLILVDVPVARSGQGSGTQSTSRQLGSALGIAVLGTILFTSLGAGLAAKLPDSLPEDARDGIVEAVADSAGAAIPGLDERSPEAAEAAREAFSDATRWSALAAGGFLLVGLAATFSLRGARRPDAAGARDEVTTPQ